MKYNPNLTPENRKRLYYYAKDSGKPMTKALNRILDDYFRAAKKDYLKVG